MDSNKSEWNWNGVFVNDVFSQKFLSHSVLFCFRMYVRRRNFDTDLNSLVHRIVPFSLELITIIACVTTCD